MPAAEPALEQKVGVAVEDFERDHARGHDWVEGVVGEQSRLATRVVVAEQRLWCIVSEPAVQAVDARRCVYVLELLAEPHVGVPEPRLGPLEAAERGEHSGLVGLVGQLTGQQPGLVVEAVGCEAGERPCLVVGIVGRVDRRLERVMRDGCVVGQCRKVEPGGAHHRERGAGISGPVREQRVVVQVAEQQL